MDGLRAAAVLHYELFPYLYGLLAGAAAGAPAARLRLPGRRPVVEHELRAARRPRPARGAGGRPRDDPDRLPSARPLGRPLHRLDRRAAAARSPGRRRSTSSRCTCAPAPSSRSTCARPPARGGGRRADASGPGRLPRRRTEPDVDLTGQPRDVQLFVPRPGTAAPRHARRASRSPGRWNAGPLPGAVIRVHGPAIQGAVVVSPS